MADRRSAGWAELAGARWESARAHFSAAIQAGETPEAFEGLSWAAWWLDDGDTVFEARRQAYRLYRRRADAPAAARMATWLACDEFDFRGARAVAGGWLRRAHRLLDPLPPGPDHGWLAFMEGYLANVAGDAARAGELARSATELGRQFEVADLEMLGLALDGARLVACAQVREGMRRLDEATASALEDEATIPISGAWTFCFLVGACVAVRDYERAVEWCDRIAEFADRYGSRYMLAFCRSEYGAVHLWRGRWDEAERMLEASVQDFARSRPAWTHGPLAALAELRRRQGRRDEAQALLDRGAMTASARLCRARLALDRGDALRAAETVERFLRQASEHDAPDRAPALELLLRARLLRGDLDAAAGAAVALRAVAQAVGTDAMRAGADAAEGMVAAARGEHERARELLEDAVDRFERGGGCYDAAQARVELATALLALGRAEAADRESAAAADLLARLGARPEAERARRVALAAPPALAVTPREREVLRLVAEGLTNRQIAARLVISEHTVHRHVANALRKLDLRSRTAAAAHAVRAGLLD